MKFAYPIIITQGEQRLVVYVPDFTINTQGETLADAIEMARDAIGIMGITLEDNGQPLPEPSNMTEVQNTAKAGEMVTLVDIDFAEYRRKNNMRAVKKNCTLPGWLSYEAEQAGINFSAVLQAALKKELHIADR